jgi:hypothetical protein
MSARLPAIVQIHSNRSLANQGANGTHNREATADSNLESSAQCGGPRRYVGAAQPMYKAMDCKPLEQARRKEMRTTPTIRHPIVELRGQVTTKEETGKQGRMRA